MTFTFLIIFGLTLSNVASYLSLGERFQIFLGQMYLKLNLKIVFAVQSKSLCKSGEVRYFYKTEFEIWTGFWLAG